MNFVKYYYCKIWQMRYTNRRKGYESMIIVNIYDWHKDGMCILEDENGKLYQWLLGARKITEVKYVPRNALEEYLPALKEGLAKGLRAYGYTVNLNYTNGKDAFLLKSVMEEKQITSAKLSEVTGIPKQTIDSYRSGNRIPSFIAGMKIADALGVEPHTLIQ